MVIVTESPFNPGEIFEKLQKDNAGSVIFHYAVVKGQSGDRRTSGIRFESSSDTIAELEEIESVIRNRWSLSDVLLIRRTGTLHVGNIISLVAVSSPASSDAFEACQYGLERLRRMQSIRKTELYID